MTYKKKVFPDILQFLLQFNKLSSSKSVEKQV